MVFVSLWQAAAAGPRPTRDIAGHASKQMLKHYSHIRMVAKRTALESILIKPKPELPVNGVSAAIEPEAPVAVVPNRSMGPLVAPVLGLTDKGGIRAVLATAFRQLGRIDVLVSYAGLGLAKICFKPHAIRITICHPTRRTVDDDRIARFAGAMRSIIEQLANAKL
jgi:NAD(P)-dependent dehydrogenase (short-subunit alcohol dehydrogenase family)